MEIEVFKDLYEKRKAKIDATINHKAKEYAPGTDRLQNFKDMALALRNKFTPLEIALVLQSKHYVSLQYIVDDMKKGVMPSEELVDEKLGDIIVYNYLVDGLIAEEISNRELMHTIMNSEYVRKTNDDAFESIVSSLRAKGRRIANAMKDNPADPENDWSRAAIDAPSDCWVGCSPDSKVQTQPTSRIPEASIEESDDSIERSIAKATASWLEAYGYTSDNPFEDYVPRPTGQREPSHAARPIGSTEPIPVARHDADRPLDNDIPKDTKIVHTHREGNTKYTVYQDGNGERYTWIESVGDPIVSAVMHKAVEREIAAQDIGDILGEYTFDD